MIGYKQISCHAIAHRLGIQQAPNGNYHCPNTQAHNSGDRNPSLSISENVFNCFGCGIKGNNIELVKQVLNIGTKQAMQWLQDEFKAGGNAYHYQQQKAIQTAKITRFIDTLKVKKYLAGLNNDVFVNELLSLGIPEDHLKKWFIGHDRGKTIFFYKNVFSQFVNAKLIQYGPDLHRIKNIPPVYMYSKKQGYGQCLYGEHQLTDDNLNTPVLLVESEKTAILGSYVLPDRIWIATGGANSLTREKAKVIAGRPVYIVMDADTAGRKSASKTQDVLFSLNIITRKIDLFPERNNGFDIADYILDRLEYFQERAAIMEYEGGLTRKEAEQHAKIIMGKNSNERIKI